jgi:tetratricopeptide (TPR) repeat protein
VRRHAVSDLVRAALACAALAWTAHAHAQLLQSPRTEAEQALQLIDAWRVDEARPIVERLIAKQPEDPLTHVAVAELKLHDTDYLGALHFYLRAKEAGAPETLLRNAALAEAARAATEGYEEVVTDGFVVRFKPGKDALLVPYTVETLEQAKAKIGALLGWKPSGRVTVELYPAASTLADVSTLTRDEIKTSGTIALCKWNRLMVTTPRAVVFGYRWRDTIAHELTHLMIGGASKNTVPIWLHEGLAKYLETAWRADPGLALSVEQQETLAKAAKGGKLIPFERMHPSMAKLKSQEETSLAFSEVFTFIEYLVAQPKGWAGIREVFAELQAGRSDTEAVQRVYGAPLKVMADRWMATLKTRKIRSEGVNEAGERVVVIKDRPDAPDDQLAGVSREARRFARAADLLYARGRIKAAQRELEKAIKAKPSPVLSAKLAVVALGANDLEAAETAVKGALKGASDLGGPYVTLADVLIRRQKPQEALEALERAIAVNPFDPRIHQLRVLATKDDAAGRAAAQRALGLLESAPRSTGWDELGTGGKVVITGPAFSRVFLTPSGKSAPVPLGTTTPTGVVELRPGTYQLKLFPPSGAPLERRITVERATGDRPQRVHVEVGGS